MAFSGGSIRTFVVVHDPKALGEPEQFVALEAKLFPSWMPVSKMVIDQERLVHEMAAGTQCRQQCRKQRPVKVEKDHDDIVASFGQRLSSPWIAFQINRSRRDALQTLRPRGVHQVRQVLLVAVDGVDGKSAAGKKQGISATPCRDVQCATSLKSVHVIA